MRKKGFTLIELLAVIVIIGIIALISTPIILNIINSTRKEAFKNSVLSVFKAAELYETKNDFEKISNDGINIKDQLQPLENGSFTSGKIIRNNNNKIEIVNVTDGVYCAKGTKDDIIVIKGSCDEFDETAPDNTKIAISNITSNSFRVVVNSIDDESGIKNYSYSIDGISFVTTTSNNYTFNNLNMNKKYMVYVRVTNNNGITTEVVTEEINTKELNEPTYSVDASGWQISKIVTITYPERETGFLYSYSIDGGDTWETVESGTTTNVTFTSNGNVIARIYDGVNYKIASSYSVTQIDTTSPSANLSLFSKTTNTITVTAAGTDIESGIVKYEFSIDNGSYINNGTNPNYTFTNVTTDTHLIKLRVTNGSGLTTESEELFISPKEITAPTYEVDKTGWQTQKIVTITYPKRETGFVYSYSINGGDTWETVENETIANVTFTTNGNVIARVYDGTNYKIASSYTVTEIDTTAPIITAKGSNYTIIEGDSNIISSTYFDISTNGNSPIISTVCIDTSNNNATVINTSSLTVGNHVINCMTTKETGLSTNGQTTIVVEPAVFEYTFNYTGNSQTFTTPRTGNYKLEVWGAQGGGSSGGAGGYATGTVNLTTGQNLYVNVGGKGGTSSGGIAAGGWNGGGNGYGIGANSGITNGGGGGATDIRSTSDIKFRLIPTSIDSYSTHFANINLSARTYYVTVYGSQFTSSLPTISAYSGTTNYTISNRVIVDPQTLTFTMLVPTATTTGTLSFGLATTSSVSNIDITTSPTDSRIIVAGGGGGGGYTRYYESNWDVAMTGGVGGGINGGQDGYGALKGYSNFATQTSSVNWIGSTIRAGLFFGGGTLYSGGGGGGGYYGGANGIDNSGDSGRRYLSSGGGGSGYVGGVTNGSMQSGVRSGNGYAKITYIGQ